MTSTAPDTLPRAEPALDVSAVRALFPALAGGTAYFDGPGGTQTPLPVGEAIANALRAPLSNRGMGTPSARNAERIVGAARQAIADLTNADPAGVVFGRSATQLTFDLSRALAEAWQPGDEVVVTRLDHDANIRPWVRAAAQVGAVVRWADFHPATGELPPEAVTRLLSDRTRLVAVTAASNLIGTRPDVAAMTRAAGAAGALVWVDGVHAAAHTPIDVAALGADFFVCSPYKFFGPHLGAVVAAPALLETLHPAKLLPSSDAVPERFELGTLPYELLAGTTAAVDVLAALAPGAGSRRERLVTSWHAVAAHESALRQLLEDGLDELGAVRYGQARRRTPTVLFDLPGVAASDVAATLARHDIAAPAGHFYAVEAARHLGLGDAGAVRAGLAAYSTATEVQRLLQVLATLPR